MPADLPKLIQLQQSTFRARRRRIFVVGGAAAVLTVGIGFLHDSHAHPEESSGDVTAPATEVSYEQEFLPFLREYCFACHGDGSHEGDFDLERYPNLDALQRDR